MDIEQLMKEKEEQIKKDIAERAKDALEIIGTIDDLTELNRLMYMAGLALEIVTAQRKDPASRWMLRKLTQVSLKKKITDVLYNDEDIILFVDILVNQESFKEFEKELNQEHKNQES